MIQRHFELVYANLYCLNVTKYILSLFLGDILGQEFPNLYDPYMQYYMLTVLYDNMYLYVFSLDQKVLLNFLCWLLCS